MGSREEGSGVLGPRLFQERAVQMHKDQVRVVGHFHAQIADLLSRRQLLRHLLQGVVAGKIKHGIVKPLGPKKVRHAGR